MGWREGEEVVVVDVGAATNQTLHSEFRSAEGRISIGGGQLTHIENPGFFFTDKPRIYSHLRLHRKQT